MKHTTGTKEMMNDDAYLMLPTWLSSLWSRNPPGGKRHELQPSGCPDIFLLLPPPTFPMAHTLIDCFSFPRFVSSLSSLC